MNGTGRDTAGTRRKREKKTAIDASAANDSHRPGPGTSRPRGRGRGGHTADARPHPPGPRTGATAATAALEAERGPLASPARRTTGERNRHIAKAAEPVGRVPAHGPPRTHAGARVGAACAPSREPDCDRPRAWRRAGVPS